MNPNQVPITLTVNIDQINMILEGLGTLPIARAEALYTGIRNHAIERLKEVEAQMLAEKNDVEAALGLDPNRPATEELRNTVLRRAKKAKAAKAQERAGGSQ